jgi:hypothetical protein
MNSEQRPYNAPHNSEQEKMAMVPGLLGSVARSLLEAAPRQEPDIAIAGAIAYLCGLCGNAFNINGAGLNQYILYLAPTGIGKDAISEGISALNNAVWYSHTSEPFPHSGAELVSASGLIKLMSRNSCNLTIVGEFGKKMKEMANPTRQHLYGLGRTILQVYSKSGKNGSFDPIAYSDSDKVTARLIRPSLTILGESVPESFYESLDETLIADGLLPRFMVFEIKGSRAYLNKAAKEAAPCPALVNDLQSFIATCNTIRNQVGAYEVPVEADAEALFDQFDRWTTDTINGSQAEVHRQLWNRAHLKALKLAALRAVGENWQNPVVTLTHAMWATDLIVAQTRNLIARFTNGDVGEEQGNEAKQIKEVIRVIKEYTHNDFDTVAAKYGGHFDMHRQGVIPEAYVQRRLITLKVFKPYPTRSIKQAIKSLLEADDLREMPPAQMLEKYGVKPRAFCVANTRRFE